MCCSSGFAVVVLGTRARTYRPLCACGAEFDAGTRGSKSVLLWDAYFKSECVQLKFSVVKIFSKFLN